MLFSRIVFVVCSIAFGVLAIVNLIQCTPLSTEIFPDDHSRGSSGFRSGILRSKEFQVWENSRDPRIVVGQLLMIAIRWDVNGKAIRKLGPEEIALLKELQPGGITLFAVNLETVAQTRYLIKQIQDACIIPPFIAIDEEGGRVSRLNTSTAIRATHIAAASELATKGPVAVWNAYSIIGNELRALGVNMDFAPIADVDENPESQVVGDRAFGSEPKLAAEMVGIAIAALEEQGVCAVIKHYPGHGRSSGDTHFGRQSIDVDWNTLLNSDLVPFRVAIDGGVSAMMTAHIEFPKIDPRKVPVSMSDVLIQRKLKHELGFTGLIITDALDMQGILSAGGPVEVAKGSIKAGVDILLCPENALKIRNAILEAWKSEQLSESRIYQSFHNILAVKNRSGILGTQIDLATNEQMINRIGSEKHHKLMLQGLQ